MKDKLPNKLVTDEIKQTSNKIVEASPIGSASPSSRKKIELIPFRDSAIDKITKTNTEFGASRFKWFKFDVSKDTSLKGLLLRFTRSTSRRDFIINVWFKGKGQYYTIGQFPHIRCKDVEKICLELSESHQDERGNWSKSPIETRKDTKRIIPKEDTTAPAGKTINEVLESYCGADEEEGHRGFLKDVKQGYKTSKSAKSIFRCMAGYSKRQSLVTFEDDDDGYCVRKFIPNKHLRVIAPVSWKDLFRKYPPGHGILKDREYYNRRKKQTYTIPASKNKSIYDSDLGKSLIEDLKPGDVEAWCRDLTSMGVKKDYIKCFTSLWFWARKRGWLGTNPGECPINLETVYVKKSFINWDEMIIDIPKGISKTKYKDEVIIITPELEIVLRNILDMGNRPGLEFYKMKDFPWLFATRRWSQERYFNKEFRLSIKTQLGGDENYIPALRQRMKEKLNDPELLYSAKVLRKTYITLSRKQLQGRADKVKHLSRHRSEQILTESYDKPQRAEVRDYANKTTSVLSFIKRRA